MAKELAFKHEGEEKGHIIGPLWIVEDDGTFRPYQTFDMGDGHQATDWFRLAQARKIAKQLGLKLVEY